MNRTAESPFTPQPGPPLIIRSRWRVSLVWLVPLVAALVGASIAVHGWLSAGPQITLSFKTAAGLEAGKTPVKYKDVTIGNVTAVRLSDDRLHVVATVDLQRSAAGFARTDTRFWVVRPRIGVGGVSGIDTVLSGAYIGVDVGQSRKLQKSFDALEAPPSVINGTSGKSFHLHSDDLGSLDIGSPVYYRRIQVGQVASYELDADGRGVSVTAFVFAPYDRFVLAGTRFWNASGIDVSLGANGLKMNTQSLATVLAGGIAFATPSDVKPGIVAASAPYVLAKDEQTAMAAPDGSSIYIQMHFDQSMRGLAVDAPVEFLGTNVGKVVSVKLDYDPATQRFPVIIGTLIYPQRLGNVLLKLPHLAGDEYQQAAQFLAQMVKHGLRAQARTGNLLTGQLYIALAFVPKAPKVDFDANARPINVPTINGSFDKLQEQLANIVDKVEKVPFDDIGRHLDANLVELNKTLRQVNGELLPEATRTMKATRQTLGTADTAFSEDGPLQRNLGETLEDTRRAIKSVRALTDLLGRHPEALLRGMPADTALPARAKETSP